jgi:hypothetical protein
MANRESMRRSWDYRDLETAVTAYHQNPEQIRNHAYSRVQVSLVAGADLWLMKANRIIQPNTRLIATKAGPRTMAEIKN